MPLDFDALSTEATPESLKAEMAARLAEKGLDVDTREGSYTDLLFSEAAYQIYKGLSYHQTLLAAAVPSPESGPGWINSGPCSAWAVPRRPRPM